jgi:tetratricopeptide (TPR) repeat protein
MDPMTDTPAHSMDALGETSSLWNQGLRLEQAGDTAGALSAYSQATDAGEQPQQIRAVLRHAEQLEQRGMHEVAEAAYRLASESDESDVRAAAWRGIANYLIMSGALHEGLAALQVIVETRDSEETPRALRNMGTFREDALDDPEGARAAYEAAIACDHPLHSQGARVNLAQLLGKQGNRAAAIDLFREVIHSGHPVEAGRATVLLGLMLAEQGDELEALHWFEKAMSEQNNEWGQQAAFHAGVIYLMQRGDPDRAAVAFRAVQNITADRNTVAMAAFLHGQAEEERQDEHAALQAYERAICCDGLETDAARGARFASAKQAGTILFNRQDYGSARDLFALAASADDSEERARGAFLLGMCERKLGNRQAAIASFENALSTPGVPEEVRDLAGRSLVELSRTR